MYLRERKSAIRDSDEKCGMRDSREKGGECGIRSPLPDPGASAGEWFPYNC